MVRLIIHQYQLSSDEESGHICYSGTNGRCRSDGGSGCIGGAAWLWKVARPLIAARGKADIDTNQVPTCAKEKATRDADIQSEIARLQARLKTTPSEAKMTELHVNQNIVDNFGWEPQQRWWYSQYAADVAWPKYHAEKFAGGFETTQRRF